MENPVQYMYFNVPVIDVSTVTIESSISVLEACRRVYVVLTRVKEYAIYRCTSAKLKGIPCATMRRLLRLRGPHRVFGNKQFHLSYP